MTKYKEYVDKMLTENKEAFEEFKNVHDMYALDNEKWQGELNKVGESILEIVREYENRVCANTERGMYNKFSTGLAEKFQKEVKKHFPLIDHVGLIIGKVDVFELKKINL